MELPCQWKTEAQGMEEEWLGSREESRGDEGDRPARPRLSRSSLQAPGTSPQGSSHVHNCFQRMALACMGLFQASASRQEFPYFFACDWTLQLCCWHFESLNLDLWTCCDLGGGIHLGNLNIQKEPLCVNSSLEYFLINLVQRLPIITKCPIPAVKLWKC